MKNLHFDKRRFSYYQLLMLVLSIYLVLATLIRELEPIPSRVLYWVDVVDTLVCLFLLFDFLKRFRAAPNKWRFMQWGWIDLLASIPLLPWLHVGQMLRIIRILRMVRAFRSTRQFLHYLFRGRANGTLAVVLLSALLIMVFGAIAMLSVEQVPGANIKTIGDAIWWAFVTITTVGYGDHYPVTGMGRLIAAGMMIVGVGLFGTFTGYVASFFSEEEQVKTELDVEKLITEIQLLRQKIEEIEKRLP